MAVSIGLGWHSGEEEMHKRMGGDILDNPTFSGLTPRAAMRLPEAPLLAIGTVDSKGQPWTTVWGGNPGYAVPVGQSMIAVKTPVDDTHDPVVQALCKHSGEAPDAAEAGKEKMVGGLTMDLDNRNRHKLFGRLLGSRLGSQDDTPGSSQVQLITRIDQSLGNCPKYLNRKTITAAQPAPELVSDSPQLVPEARALIAKADLFFLSSSNSDVDMDTNHRGGPPGFVRSRRVDEDGSWEIIWPEYSGNRLYQTLGNLVRTPLAGLVFPDFETGDVLYATGRTEILVGKDASAIMPRSSLAVKLSVAEARFVRKGLPFRGANIESSPYNPRPRPLATEASVDVGEKGLQNSVRMMEQENITPTISRFRFKMSNPAKYRAGQYATFDFSDELDIGYSHMRDDDPRSLNDDFVRTFTISSPPPPHKDITDDTFDIIIRRVGKVTDFMFKVTASWGLEVPLRGFGGDFAIEQQPGVVTPFIAGGVGITPLLGSVDKVDMAAFRLFWTIHVDDANLVAHTLKRHPPLAPSMYVYFTGGAAADEKVEAASRQIRELGASVEARRLARDDLLQPGLGDKYYVCAGTGFRKTLLDWLQGKEVIYEDFNF